MSDQARLTSALVVSIFLHALMLTLLPWMRQLRVQIPQPPALLDVDVLPPPKAPPPPAPPAAVPVPPQPPAPAIRLPEHQIVSPSDAGEEKPPPDTRLLSDRDNTVKEQSVQHSPEPSQAQKADAAEKQEAPPE